MKELFELQSSQLGDGRILARWGCKGSALCAVGTKRHFLIFNKEGRETHSYPLGPATGPAKSQPKDGVCVNDMQWSPDGALPNHDPLVRQRRARASNTRRSAHSAHDRFQILLHFA